MLLIHKAYDRATKIRYVPHHFVAQIQELSDFKGFCILLDRRSGANERSQNSYQDRSLSHTRYSHWLSEAQSLEALRH